jgi:predicted dehydrogenase
MLKIKQSERFGIVKNTLILEMHIKLINVQIIILVTDVQLVVKIGIIGLRNHAERLKAILDERNDCQVCFLYHPTKKINDARSTNDISDIYKMNAIFIASPNNTHVKYIDLCMKNSNGYIFCEKPPATSNAELKVLRNITNNKKKIFFNFNFRFSKLNEIIKELIITDKIGKIINIGIIASQGLAFKDGYIGSWRADGKKNLHNIIETISIRLCRNHPKITP